MVASVDETEQTGVTKTRDPVSAGNRSRVLAFNIIL